MKILRLLAPLAIGAAMTALLLLYAGLQPGAASDLPAAHENRDIAPSMTVLRYVAVTGEDSGDCSDPAAPCRTIQYAVDCSNPSDEVRIAAGIYDDVHVRPRIDFITEGTVTQTVYITQSVSLVGGFPPGEWEHPDPYAHPTIIDPGGEQSHLYLGSRRWELRLRPGSLPHLPGCWRLHRGSNSQQPGQPGDRLHPGGGHRREGNLFLLSSTGGLGVS